MKTYISVTILAFLLFIPSPTISGEIKENNKPPYVEPFILEVYENGKKKEDRVLYVDLKILNKNDVQWTTVFLDSSRCIKKDTPLHVPIVSRWDTAISDVVYDKDSFQMKLKFRFANEEHIVRGHRMTNDPLRFNVEGVGFRNDLSMNNIKIEWKVIEKDPNDVDAYFYLGQKYLDTGKPLSAVIIYEKALQKHPFASDLTLNLAHSYYAINDITNSIIYLIKAEKLYLIKSDFGRLTKIPAIRKHLRTALNESGNKREDFDFVMIPSYSEVKSTIDKPKLPAEYKAGFLKLLNEEKQGKITQKRLKLLNEVRHQGWALFVNGATP